MGRQTTPGMVWTVQLRVPLDGRLVRRASPAALQVAIGRALISMVNSAPLKFLEDSAARLKSELQVKDTKLVSADGRPYRV